MFNENEQGDTRRILRGNRESVLEMARLRGMDKGVIKMMAETIHLNRHRLAGDRLRRKLEARRQNA
jgi:hypothetical protein